MQKYNFIAVFEPTDENGYSVYFPDVLGCITCGKTYEEALEMAKEALGIHLYEMEKDNLEIPNASKMSEIEIDEETEKGYILSPISVYPALVKEKLDNKAVKTNVTLPAWLKEMAELEKVNYSLLLQTALKEYLNV